MALFKFSEEYRELAGNIGKDVAMEVAKKAVPSLQIGFIEPAVKIMDQQNKVPQTNPETDVCDVNDWFRGDDEPCDFDPY